MKVFKSLIQKILTFFASGKAEAALTQAVGLVPKALPIVEELAALAPDKTVQQIASAFQKYGVPFSQEYLSMPAQQRGYLLLQLATQVLAAEVPGVATNILNTAVQLAVTGVKA
jgi:hypothetical protein